MYDPPDNPKLKTSKIHLLSMSTFTEIVERIEDGLNQYYNLFNREYNGEFAKYCQDCGLESEEYGGEYLNKELNQEDFKDTLIIDFDDNFPFPRDISNHQLPKFMQSVLNACNDGTIDQFITMNPFLQKPISLILPCIESSFVFSILCIHHT